MYFVNKSNVTSEIYNNIIVIFCMSQISLISSSSFLVYLRTSPEICMERMKARCRSEEKTIPMVGDSILFTIKNFTLKEVSHLLFISKKVTVCRCKTSVISNAQLALTCRSQCKFHTIFTTLLRDSLNPIALACLFDFPDWQVTDNTTVYCSIRNIFFLVTIVRNFLLLYMKDMKSGWSKKSSLFLHQWW